MAKQVFAIPGLVEEIYDFGDVGRDVHRRKMLHIRDDLRFWFYNAARELEDSYSSDYACARTHMSLFMSYGFISYVHENYSMDEIQDYAKYLKRCRCCSRHSHYKTGTKPSNPVPESKFLTPCRCKCRYYYRLFQTKLFV